MLHGQNEEGGMAYRVGKYHMTDLNLRLRIYFQGENDGLSLFIKRTYPNVICNDTVAFDRSISRMSCRQPLDRMLTSETEQVFGNKSTAGVQVDLPALYMSGTNNYSILTL